MRQISEQNSSACRHADDESEFDALVAPLERSAGKRLKGSGRLKCLVAFREAPDGFGAIAEAALRRANSNAVGLLICMVEDGEHHLAGCSRRFEQALAWARKTAPQLPPDVQEDVIAGFDLSGEDEEKLRAAIRRPRAA